ncbi:MAG TPA: NAD(P)/FAD-dependent oxidoreductase [Solirubrobacteraceae bacterium]|jgi:NADH dehydrogenase|nr:NAD(P)/FAD-dependent oxidoreductase [Solirubrobacteraceae bacterium]
MAHDVLILGGGFGGLTAARRLERKLPPQSAKVTLVNDVNFMLYTPLLPGAAGGTLEPRHVVVPLREQLQRTDLHLGTVLGADPDRRSVRVRSLGGRESELPYDQLIVALGSTSRTLPIPGLAEHALGFKTLPEAIALRNRMVQTLEQAELTHDEAARHALLTYVFVGAGYAGLEGAAEMQDFAADLVQRYPRSRLHGLRFVLVEVKDRVMTEIQPDLAAFASAELRRRGMEIHTSTTIERVGPDSVELSSGEIVPARTVVWTAGVKPHPVVAQLGLPLGEGGRIVADRFCAVPGRPGVWAIGDAASVPDPANKGNPSPPTAQHVLRQAKVAADNAVHALAGEPQRRRAFRYRTLGVFVDMGRHQAVASTLGIKWRGFPAWFLARTYHLALMPGTARRARLVTDWTTGLLFGRDSAELGQLGHPAGLGERSAGGTGSSQAGGDEVVSGAGARLDD